MNLERPWIMPYLFVNQRAR